MGRPGRGWGYVWGLVTGCGNAAPPFSTGSGRYQEPAQPSRSARPAPQPLHPTSSGISQRTAHQSQSLNLPVAPHTRLHTVHPPTHVCTCVHRCVQIHSGMERLLRGLQEKLIHRDCSGTFSPSHPQALWALGPLPWVSLFSR